METLAVEKKPEDIMAVVGLILNGVLHKEGLKEERLRTMSQ
jgi:hypothetical protein